MRSLVLPNPSFVDEKKRKLARGTDMNWIAVESFDPGQASSRSLLAQNVDRNMHTLVSRGPLRRLAVSFYHLFLFIYLPFH